jgi:hypothetical protein
MDDNDLTVFDIPSNVQSVKSSNKWMILKSRKAFQVFDKHGEHVKRVKFREGIRYFTIADDYIYARKGKDKIVIIDILTGEIVNSNKYDFKFRWILKNPDCIALVGTNRIYAINEKLEIIKEGCFDDELARDTCESGQDSALLCFENSIIDGLFSSSNHDGNDYRVHRIFTNDEIVSMSKMEGMVYLGLSQSMVIHNPSTSNTVKIDVYGGVKRITPLEEDLVAVLNVAGLLTVFNIKTGKKIEFSTLGQCRDIFKASKGIGIWSFNNTITLINQKIFSERTECSSPYP